MPRKENSVTITNRQVKMMQNLLLVNNLFDLTVFEVQCSLLFSQEIDEITINVIFKNRWCVVSYVPQRLETTVC